LRGEHGQKRTAATLAKHKNLLEKRLLPWCEEQGYRLLKQLDVAVVREFRSGWSDSAITAQKNLERLRAFFWFCHSANWVKVNPAISVKAPKPGKPSERVKVFTDEQLKSRSMRRTARGWSGSTTRTTRRPEARGSSAAVWRGITGTGRRTTQGGRTCSRTPRRCSTTSSTRSSACFARVALVFESSRNQRG
jgi:hypothetical protein